MVTPRRIHGHAARTALIAALLLASSPAAAEISGDAGELYSIEKRNVMGSHELSVSVGTLPMDAFGVGLALQGGYAYHFNQLMGWEIVGGMWAFNFGTGLKEELKERFDVQPTDVGELKWIIHSS